MSVVRLEKDQTVIVSNYTVHEKNLKRIIRKY